MSRLMAESMDLNFVQNSSYSLSASIDGDYINTELGMSLFEERAHQGSMRREINVLTSHLKGVHERVSHTLKEAGYSTELPEPRLDDVPAISFRPPDFCIKTEEKETEEQKEVRQLCRAFLDCSKTRNDLIRSVRDWLKSTSADLDGRTFRAHVEALARREVDVKTSWTEVTDALNHAKIAVDRLKMIWTNIFDEKPDEYTNSAMAERTLHIVNERCRRNSEAIDSAPKQKREELLKRPLNIFKTSEDISVLLENRDITDEDDRALVAEMTSEWKTVCNDIWDLLASVHESKMIARTTKLKIRRVIYLYKLVTAFLAIRDSMVRTAEEQLLDAQTEVVALKAKLDNIQLDTNQLREKYKKTQNIVVKVSKERDESRYEADKLRKDLGSCIDKIAEMNSLIRELKSEAAMSIVLPDDEQNENMVEMSQVVELQEQAQKQDFQIGEMQLEIDALLRERNEMRAQLDEVVTKNMENDFLLEQRLYGAEEKLEQANITIQQLQGKIYTLSDDLFEREKGVKLLKLDLESKEAIIEKLKSVAEEGSDSDSETLPRKSRNLQRMKSSDEVRETKGSDYEKRISISQLARASSTRILRKSSIRLIPPTPKSTTTVVSTRSVNSQLGESEAAGEAIGTTLDATTQVSRAELTMLNDEYMRVREGWEQSELKCRELEADVVELEEELKSEYKLNKKRLSTQAREFRMKSLLEEENYRFEVNSIYAEAMNMESMINRYKNVLSVTFERALFPKIAKDAKNAYNYNSADSPADHVSSLKTTNEWIEVALQKLVKCQQSVLKQMQNAQDALKLTAERSMGEETVHHIKMLAEKSKELERCKNQADRTRNDLNTLKTEQHKLFQENERNKAKLRDALEEETRIKELCKRREKELFEAGDAISYKIAINNAQDMEIKIRNMKVEFKKLKGQLELSQKALARETKLAMIAKKRKSILKIESRGRRATDMNLIPRRIQRLQGLSQSGTYANTLEKLLDMKPTLNLSHITTELASHVEESVKNYKGFVADRLADLFERYIAFRRHTDMQDRIRATILALKSESKNKGKGTTGPRWHENLGKFQTIYWHLQSRQESIKTKFADNSASLQFFRYRNDLGNAFRSVAQVLLKKKQEMRDNAFASELGCTAVPSHPAELIDNGQKSAASGPHPIAPSNSVTSLSSKDNTKKSADFSGENDKSQAGDEIKQPTRENEINAVEMEIFRISAAEVRRAHEDKNLVESEQTEMAGIQMVTQGKANAATPPQSRTFLRNVSLTPRVSEEFRKNQNLLSSVAKSSSNGNVFSSVAPATERVWDRRMSLAVPPSTPAWTAGNNFSHRMKQSFMASPEVPKTLQLDVHEYLHKARKQLQDSLRRYSLNEYPFATLPSDLTEFIRSRQSTMFPRATVSDDKTLIDEKELLKSYKLGFEEQKSSPPKSNARTSDAFQIEVVQPPSNLPSSTSTRSHIRARKDSEHSRSESVEILIEQRNSSTMERSDTDSKGSVARKISRCLSDECSTSSSTLGGLSRRKSTSDVLILPSLSSTSNSNK